MKVRLNLENSYTIEFDIDYGHTQKILPDGQELKIYLDSNIVGFISMEYVIEYIDNPTTKLDKDGILNVSLKIDGTPFHTQYYKEGNRYFEESFGLKGFLWREIDASIFEKLNE